MSATDTPSMQHWVSHRNLLFTVSYEMLGSASAAEPSIT